MPDCNQICKGLKATKLPSSLRMSHMDQSVCKRLFVPHSDLEVLVFMINQYYCEAHTPPTTVRELNLCQNRDPAEDFSRGGWVNGSVYRVQDLGFRRSFLAILLGLGVLLMQCRRLTSL